MGVLSNVDLGPHPLEILTQSESVQGLRKLNKPPLPPGNSMGCGPSPLEGRGQEMGHKGRDVQLIFKGRS